MTRAILAAWSGALLVATFAGSAAAAPPTPAAPSRVQPQAVAPLPIDRIKMLSDRVDALETDNAQKAQEIAALNAQTAALKADIAALKAEAGNYITTKGPGYCVSHGYINAGSLPANPGVLVYNWGGCKAP